MKKKPLLVLSTLALGLSVVSCNRNDNESNTAKSNEMDKYVDLYDNEKTDIFYASPSVEIEYDFDKCLNEGIDEYLPKDTKHKGTLEDPMDIYTALHSAGAGDTVYLLPGTYKTDNRITLSHSGNSKRPINVTVLNDDNHKGNAILDFSAMLFDSNNRGIQLNGSYWRFYGIECVGAGDNGMYIGGSYNIIERCLFHENSDTGLQLGRSSGINDVANWPHNNLILNCTSYNNYDVETLGENADGFAAKLTVGEGNIFDGCIAYRNSDDGWDMFAKTDSGNIGTITLLNCVAFENGWVLNKTRSATAYKESESGYLDSFMTQNGDGNGFKLGGSIMTGDVIMKNCMAFNNRMGGFADNSNPGTLSLTDCTSYNNSVYLSMTTTSNTIDPTGDTGIFGDNDGENSNFAMARTEASYNNFESCLSVITNNPSEKELAWDTYRGSAAYSIFATGKNAYSCITEPQDCSSYLSKQSGTKYDGVINDSIFKSVYLLGEGKNCNGNVEIDSLFRNADGSVNMHDYLALKDENLLKFNNGKPVGCVLNKEKSEDYEHVNWKDLTGQDMTKKEHDTLRALEALEVVAKEKFVFQDVDLITQINGFTITWFSSNEDVIGIGYEATTSISGRSYIKGNVKRDRNEDKVVTLTATISKDDITVSKDFEFIVKKEIPGIGKVTGFDKKYIVEQFDYFSEPTINVTDIQSYADNLLVKDRDYSLTKTYEYASSTNDEFYVVDNIYTAKAGVYKVNYDIKSLLTDGKEISGYYLVYVLSPNSNIDISSSTTLAETYNIEMTNDKVYTVNACRDGAKVTAAFTNIYGYMYVATSDHVLTADEIIAQNQRVDIVDEVAEIVALNDNTSNYVVSMVVTNRAKTKDRLVVSEVYSAEITSKEINSEEELYTLLTGSSNSKVVYLLTRDLDYSNTSYDWTNNTAKFSGVLNGKFHTISNITIESDNNKKSANIVYTLNNGTIMNINFDNINITSSNTKDSDTGIIGNMRGGYLSNIKLTNVYVSGITEVGALVGQVSGGSNFIDKISLTGDYSTEAPDGTDERKEVLYKSLKPAVKASGKYFGGIVGNMQKDTDQLKVELTMSQIYVKAYIGIHNDGGYIGGILGRDKNEFESYKLVMNSCYFDGVVDTNKTYSGGIVGSLDSAAGSVKVTNCGANVTLVCGSITLDKEHTEIGQKNNSPILGRFTYNEFLCELSSNYGPYAEYHYEVSSNVDEFASRITTEKFYSTYLEFDMDNTWNFVKDADKVIGLELKR